MCQGFAIFERIHSFGNREDRTTPGKLFEMSEPYTLDKLLTYMKDKLRMDPQKYDMEASLFGNDEKETYTVDEGLMMLCGKGILLIKIFCR